MSSLPPDVMSVVCLSVAEDKNEHVIDEHGPAREDVKKNDQDGHDNYEGDAKIIPEPNNVIDGDAQPDMNKNDVKEGEITSAASSINRVSLR
jgi:hypothetical protein